MQQGIKYIVVDDERLARTEMKRIMQQFNAFVFAGEAGNAATAATLIAATQPDLIFLDIEMPGYSGLQLLADLEELPAVIFTTAYDHYAVKAFDLNAVDYLLKPIRQERLEQALEKIKEGKTARTHLLIKEGDQLHFFKKTAIYLIGSVGNYARIYFDDQKVFYKKSLNQIEQMLPTDLFFRINRSQIVNLSFVKNITQTNGRLALTMQNGEMLTVSNRRSALFKTKVM